jgi:hypothetical protein
MPLTAQQIFAAFSPLWQTFPYLPDCFAPWQELTLGEIAANSYNATKKTDSPSSAVIECMAAQTSKILGTAQGKALAQSLSKNNAVLSANLHGIDCLPEMVQAVHTFALDRLALGQQGTVIPVLSCGGVSLQSQAYPRGLQSFRGAHAVRFPLFSSASQNKVVLNAPALTSQEMLNSRAHWQKTLPYEQQALQAVLERLLSPQALAQERFSDQITQINAWLCQERYPDLQPLVVYLELEEIARQLLLRDLEKPTSLLYRILFLPAVRKALIQRLADVRGCWSSHAATGGAFSRDQNNGTLFFWGIDTKGRRCALQLREERGKLHLACSNYSLPFTPENLIQALRERSIYPGLFVAYMSLVYEHGLRCYGGIFLVRYLSTMLHHVREVFCAYNESLPPTPAATALAAFAITVQSATKQGLAPAGALEMLSAGGLKRAHMQSLAQTPLCDILPYSLALLGKEYCPTNGDAAWEKQLAQAAQSWKGIVLHP